MLTSSNPNNQYLRPEYLSPLPTTMDSKQSPLALLAQTCSAIGADSPNPKLLANIEKSAKSSAAAHQLNNNNNNNNNNNSLSNHHAHNMMHSNHHSKLLDNRDKLSPSGSHSSNSSSSDIPKSSFKPYESVSSSHQQLRDKTTTPESLHGHRIKTPKSSSNSAISMMMNGGGHPASQMMNGRCGSNQSASSPRASPASSNHNSNSIRKTPSSVSMTTDKSGSPHSASLNLTKEQSPASTPLDSPISLVSSNNKHSIESLSNKESSKSSSSSSSATSTPTSNTMSSVSASYLGYPGLSYPMDLMTSALMSPHHSMLKAAALNPYLNYARMKVPGGSESLMPVCRDPYCTGCALSPHMMGSKSNSTCPAGCTQCDHPANKAYSQLSNAHNNAAAAAFAHAQLAAYAAASQLPYVCSWVAGDTPYCGKRFGSPEELLQHLRSHTSMPESMLNPAAAAAVAGLPPSHPLFSRTYPTPPLSPLSTARYHPYSKPSMMSQSLAQSSLAGMQMPPHPSLAQYFSPYSLYGPRLGTPPSMHP